MSATVRDVCDNQAQQDSRKARDASNSSRKAGMLAIGRGPTTIGKPTQERQQWQETAVTRIPATAETPTSAHIL
jgi:hypothetical protein